MNRFALILLSLSLGACAARKIPGTEIDDTDDSRAIIAVLERLRTAIEKKDAETVIMLADESFRDDGGSAAPEDDLDYATLPTVLPARFGKLDDIRLDLAVRKIEFDEETEVARATYTYTATFRLPSLTPKQQSETEIKQMILKRSGKDGWKIVTGI